MASGSVAAAATDLGDWTQAQGSALHTGVVAQAPAPPYQEAWSAAVPTGGPNQQFGLSPPVISGRTVVTVAPEQVLGFDLESGTPTFTVDRTLGPSVPPALATVGRTTAVVYTEGFGSEPPSAVPTSASPSTPTSSPPSPSAPSSTASPGTTVAPLSAASQLAAFNLQSQKPLWPPIALDEVSRTGVTVEGSTAYVGDDLGTIYAIDLTKGTIEWRGAVGAIPAAPVAVAGDLVVLTVPGNAQQRPAVVALKTADGTQAWRYEGEGLGVVISGAAIAGDTVYAGFADNSLRALNLTDGSLRWRGRLNAAINPTGSPAITDDAIYALDLFGQISRFDPATGDRVWDYAINEPVFRGAPVVAGDRVLAATGKGRLVAIDPASGHAVWESDASKYLLRSLTPTSDLILAVRGGPQAGLVAFRHDEGGALVDLVSPTVFNAGTFARALAMAVIPFLLVAGLIGRVLSARMGPAFIVEDGDPAPEPVDPWDTEGGERG